MHLSNINFESREIWPYPCCWLCMWRLTNIMAAREKNGKKRSGFQERKVHICVSINSFTRHTGTTEILGWGALQQCICQLWKWNWQYFTFHYIMSQESTEYLLTIAAIERVNTATATMMTIRVNWSKRERKKDFHETNSKLLLIS